jgi:hypothetical protein
VSQIDWLREHPAPLRSITALVFPPCLPYLADLPSLFSTAYMGYVWECVGCARRQLSAGTVALLWGDSVACAAGWRYIAKTTAALLVLCF